MKTRKLTLTLAAAALVALMVACGGGNGTNANGNGGGNGGSPIGGITRTGAAVAVGPVTGFGSVILNGIEYDTSAAKFTIDGSPGTQDDLAVGDIVLVRGTIDDNNNAAASSVEFDDNVEGPIQAGSIGPSSFIVLGQTVLVDDVDTSWDDVPGNSIAGLNDGDIVEVSGHVMADGSVVATRVELKSVLPPEFEVTGIVSANPADPGMTTTFMINQLIVDFATRGAAFDTFPGNRSVMEGDPVEVKGETTLGLAGELVATRVEYRGEKLDGAEGDHVEIEGLITDFTSSEQFSVGEVDVITDPVTTEFEGGDRGDLDVGVKVEVEGEYNAAGELVATKVQVKFGEAVRITALVSETVPDLILLNVVIETDPLMTRFEDKTGAVREGFGVDDIQVGDYLEVRGQEFPLASGILQASILERDDPDAETIIQGFARSVARPDFDVLGVVIETNAGTVFRDENENFIGNPDMNFWPRVTAGSLLKAKGTTVIAGAPLTLIADEVELQAE